MVTVGGCAEGSEEDKDEGRDQQGVAARPVITCVAEEELANDSSSKGNRADVALRTGSCVLLHVNRRQHGVDGPDDLSQRLVSSTMARRAGCKTHAIEVAIGEETCAGCDDRPATFPSALGNGFEGSLMHVIDVWRVAILGDLLLVVHYGEVVLGVDCVGEEVERKESNFSERQS